MQAHRIYIGSDHAGFQLKNIIREFLHDGGYAVEDIGPYSYERGDDYPDYALKVCKKILKSGGRGILICGSGQGMDRAANKIPGIYSSVCWNEESAVIAKEHGDINVLCLGGRLVGPSRAKRIIKIWLERPYKNKKRHERRINKIKEMERNYTKYQNRRYT